VGEGGGFAHVGETPECPKERLLRGVLGDLMITNQQISKPYRALGVSGIYSSSTRSVLSRLILSTVSSFEPSYTLPPIPH
jgi:hypothetical protein